jgi:hypothetical protein
MIAKTELLGIPKARLSVETVLPRRFVAIGKSSNFGENVFSQFRACWHAVL